MAEAEPAPGRRGRSLSAALGAALGAAAGTGAALGGVFGSHRRRHDDPPPGDTSGRGEPGTPPSPQAVRGGFETEDMSGALMGALTVGLGVAITISIWLMVLMLHGFQASREASPPLTAQERTDPPPPPPRLQPAPWNDLADAQHRAQDRLDRYGWVDPQHRRARIPIGIAMERTVGQSLDPASDALP